MPIDSSPYVDKRTVLVPAQFLVDRKEFLDLISEVGQGAGLDSDWYPPNLHEAVYEGLISAESPSDSGMVVRPAHFARSAEVFTTEVYIGLLEDPAAMLRQHEELIPKGFGRSLDNLLLILLNQQMPPVDLGFEIIDNQAAVKEPTAHELIEELNKFHDWRYKGQPVNTIFVP